MIRCLRSVIVPVVLLGVMVQPSQAVVVPKDSALSAKMFRHPNLVISSLEQPADDLSGLLTSGKVNQQLSALRAQNALYDWRGARWSSLVLSQPLVPGDGLGNTLSGARPTTESDVWRALSAYISSHHEALLVDLAEMPSPRVGIFEKGNIINIHAPRVVGGIPVRDSSLSAVLNHGNLILFGLQNWGTVDASITPALSADAASAVVEAHLKPFAVAGYDDAHLEWIPLARGQDMTTVAPGRGYDYRLVWTVYPRMLGDMGTWEGLVDAITGELIAFQDRNSYAARRITGGVYPFSNDQQPPDGIEQPNWPMPFANVVGSQTSTTSGSGQVLVCEMGNIQTTLNGQFVQISDNCGAINENSPAGDLNLGVSGGDDCTIPGGHSVGDTHSARSGFYELNRIKEQARGHLPANPWLQAKLIATMNINNFCNAFWNGVTVNFYRSGGNCANTGEIAGVFDHEWGHGLDDNGTNGTLSQPQEAVADIYANLRLDASCVGRGFLISGNCGGYGDPCTACDGVRDTDFAKHASGQPHGINWILSNCSAGGPGPCGREVHCEGYPMAEVAWDLHARDLQAAPYNFDNNTALELATRLYYLTADGIATYYTCIVAGGCNAAHGYMTYLGMDDDNGNIGDGTPHMTAIRAAFQRHQLHCATPPVVDSGCSGGPTAAPVAIAVPSATEGDAIDVTWTAVPGAANYAVYRTESVVGCNFGKIKVGTVSGTSFTETGLLDGRTYLYSVLPIGSNTSCFGLMSNCASSVSSVPDDPCVPVELQTFEVE
jgi:trimeric autotransporter adhesin